MSDAKFFQRGKVHDLRAELTSEKKDPRHQRKKVAMKKVVANMTMGNDMSPLYQEVISCMGIPDIEVKKMVYLFLINYARARAEIANLAVDGFEDDVNDSNPLVRAMAIRTMGYIYVDQVIESLIDPLRHCLRDRDPYVRKTAAMAVLKLCMFDRSLVEEERFLDMLKDLLADSNPSVVANAVAALTEISERSPNIKLKLNMKIANKLITALNECNEWGQVYILESLMYVVPQETLDAETIIERITPRLQHGNSSVVLVAIKVITYMLNYVAKVEVVEQVLRKLSPPLVTLLSSGPEVQYVTLRNIQLLLQRWPTLLQNQLRSFFCKYDDPIYVKLAKLEVILALTTEDNARVVLSELAEYATEIDIDFVRKAVRSIGRIAIRIEYAADKCVRTLLDLIQTKVNYVVQEAIIVIRDIFRKYPDRYEGIIGTLCENLDSLDEPEARAAMIWIIGQYADRIDNSDEVLETFLETFLEDPAEVQLALLTAIVKLFITRPTAGQDLVPKVLKWATEEVDSPDIRDRGFIYWRLLSTDPEMTREIVLSDKPEITAEAERLEMPLLDELLLQIGTLSSIYRKPPMTFINFAKKRVLSASPALTRIQIEGPQPSKLPRTSKTSKVSAMSRPISNQATRAGGETVGSSTNISQANPSLLDMGGAAGLSNPYINDLNPGPVQGNDAALIDLMSMDDDEGVDSLGTAMQSNAPGLVNSMTATNLDAGMGLLNTAMPTSTSSVNIGMNGSEAATQGTSAFGSIFDSAGLDMLANVSSRKVMGSNTVSPSSGIPGLMHSLTSPVGNASMPSMAISNTFSTLATSSQPLKSGHVSALFGDNMNDGLMIASTYTSTTAAAAVSAIPMPVNNGNSFMLQQQTPITAGLDTASQPNVNTSGEGALGPHPFPATATISGAFSTSLISETKAIDDLALKMYNTGLGNSATNFNTAADVPYVPTKTVLLDAQQTQGLEILGTFARRSGQIQMEMALCNKSGIPISEFAIQFNKNTYGLAPAAPLSIGTIMPMTSGEVCLQLMLGGPSMAMSPLNNIQIAIKCTAGIFYFQTQYSLHILFDETGQCDQGTFLRMWRDIPETMQSMHSVQSLRFASIEDMRNKLNMNNVFTIAQRSVGQNIHFYTTSKLHDGTMFYSEIKVASNFQAAVITTKSTNTPLIGLYQKAIEDILTAF